MTKTNTFDDTVILGASCKERNWVNGIFGKFFRFRAKLMGGRDSKAPLLDLTLVEYEQCLRLGSEHLALPTRRALPHQLRHGGASMDGLTSLSIEFIQARGRWSELKNVRRYKKQGRYLKRLSMLSDVQMTESARMRNFIQEGCTFAFSHVF